MKKGVLLPKEHIVHLDFNNVELKTKKQGRDVIAYINKPASYDIETSSFRDSHSRKVAITYSHAINIDGYCFKMETWEQFRIAINYLSEMYRTNPYRRLVIYVHNLAYEFQFMKKHFNFTRVFNNGAERKTLTALTDTGIEFRCSYMLSGANLEKTAEDLLKYKIKKLKGDLDYDLIRTPITPLTRAELDYILNDVVIIEYFIREEMSKADNDITKLPLTKTGYVRNHTRENTIKGSTKSAKNYRALIKDLVLTADEYQYARRAFAGGYTHASVNNVNQTLYDVKSMDINSSYPGVMLTKKYPMSKGELYEVKNKADFMEQISLYCCMFYIELIGVWRTGNDAYLSVHKTSVSSGVNANNGRIDSASSLSMWMTEVDFRNVVRCYDVDDYKVHKMYRYKPGYLPTPLIKTILELYKKKTELKDVAGREEDYMAAKAMLNSLFGMCVMDIVKDSYEWDDEEKISAVFEPNIEETVEQNNKSKKRFLSYMWGVYITAYGREELFRVISELPKGDYVYADTDSIKFLNGKANMVFFEQANKRIEREMRKACEFHKIDYEETTPKDPKGKVRSLGHWEDDGLYLRFKTLGAKRYMVESLNKKGEKVINITVSGVNKSVAVPYLLNGVPYDATKSQEWNEKRFKGYGEAGIFDAFESQLEIPPGFCGKSTHAYVDDERRGVVTDYLGTTYEYHELSGVHLEETDYKFKISDVYAELIERIQNQPKKKD